MPGSCRFVLVSAVFVALLWSSTRSAPERGPLKKARKVGNPNLECWPGNDSANAHARSVWDMHFFRGRIYIGGGDLGWNMGPVTIWSLGPGRGASLSYGFKAEYVAEDEQVSYFRDAGGMLVVPGADPKEGWELGNLYAKNPQRRAFSGWSKIRTIPNGIHVYDFLCHRGDWYVSMGGERRKGVLRSRDRGKTWDPLVEEGWMFLPLSECFLILGERTVLRCDGGTTVPRQIDVDLYPGTRYEGRGGWTGFRRASFGSGVVYARAHLGLVGGRDRAPLFFLEDSQAKDGGAARLVEPFADEQVQDVLVRDGRCHVLTAERPDPTAEGCRGVIRSSADLAEWDVAADFIVPGVPFSFEMLGGRYFVGLGARPVPGGYLGPESGSIYLLD